MAAHMAALESPESSGVDEVASIKMAKLKLGPQEDGQPPMKQTVKAAAAAAGTDETENGGEDNVLQNVLLGRGLGPTGFANLVIFVATVLVLAAYKPQELGSFARYLLSPLGLTSIATALAWTMPFKEFSYVLDRIGAVRAQLHNILPYGPSLLPTLPEMLPFTDKIVANIERVGEFMPVLMQPGCKEYIVPLMPKLMPDLELMLDAAPVLAPVMPRIAPSLGKMLPYVRQLLPYADALVPIVEVDGWEALNDHMNVLAPCIDKVAPYTKDLAPYLPRMAPYMPILTKHIDNLIASMDETILVLDRMMPLLPLLPAADQAGLLDQPMAFKALPQLLKRSFISNELAGRAALTGANMHMRMVDTVQGLQDALSKRYQLYLSSPMKVNGPKAILDVRRDTAEDMDTEDEDEYIGLDKGENLDDDDDDNFDGVDEVKKRS